MLAFDYASTIENAIERAIDEEQTIVVGELINVEKLESYQAHQPYDEAMNNFYLTPLFYVLPDGEVVEIPLRYWN